MIQQFLTISETAEKLKGKGYAVSTIEAYIREKKVPHHFRDGKFLIPFPEAEAFFPPISAIEDKPVPEDSESPKKAPQGAPKKATK